MKMPRRLVFLKDVPRFVGSLHNYGPFEQGSTYDFSSDELFVDVLIYRGLAREVPIVPPASNVVAPPRQPKRRKTTVVPITRWFK